ncbi:MAG: 2-amino-4-hydroxy-6-hydroxymethyldihydropteridine diphosphokinase [Gammaproteobacteria bacterium]|nr:2-amino-4-hydroxy-6-hydroxymethyldihydropteridine diphosphokinase [Gammaproteobacteria bacterium]
MKVAACVVYIGLGSNLDDPVRQVGDALLEMRQIPGSRLVRHSRLYRSTPIGPQDQPDYVNAAAMLETALGPFELLDALQQIEKRHRRERSVRWGPRTLDLDLLLYADRRIDSPRLQVPHPQMHRRAFVLVPLHEIAPQLTVPGQGALAVLLADVDMQGLRAVGEVDTG